MKLKLPKSAKTKVKEERAKIFEKMCAKDITQAEWEQLNKKYQTYSDMMKTSWTISPDVLFTGVLNIFGLVLVLNFEKMDIIRSKAITMLFKGRV